MQFYLNCRKIPLIGRYVLGPFLSFWWDAFSALRDVFTRESKIETPVLSTYASVISGMKIRIESLERRHEQLSNELESLKWQIDLRSKFESAALDGVRRALENHINVNVKIDCNKTDSD